MSDSPQDRGAYDLPLFTGKTQFSLRSLNRLVRRTNALGRMSPARGDADGQLIVGESNCVLPLANEIQTSSGGGSGNMDYLGAYSGAVDYVFGDVVYVGSLPANRFFYVCEIANGPTAGTHAPDATEAGTIYWRLIAQPGGKYTKMVIDSIFGDYLGCHDSASHSANVAKPSMLRFSVASRVINTYTYNYTYALPNSRFISGTTNPGVFAVNEIIEPEYQVGDIIFAASADHTGVTVSAVELQLIDANIDQRGWVMTYGQ